MNRGSKLTYLEGLRGIASLMVVFTHYYGGWYLSPTIINQLSPFSQSLVKSPISLIWNGQLAVCIFFVLSGYVLSIKFFETNNRDIVISSALRRYWRLSIPCVVSMLFAYVLLKNKLYFNQEVFEVTSSPWIRLFWRQFPDIFEVLKEGFYGIFLDSNASTYNAVLWTMKWEFLGSFMVFAICYLIGNSQFRNYYYFCVTLMLLLAEEAFLLAFLFGMILSDLSRQEDSRAKIMIFNTIICWGLLFMGLLFIVFLPFIQVNVSFRVTPYIYVLSSLFIVIATLGDTGIKKIFDQKACAFLGRISFPLYLVHLPILCSFSSYMFLTLLRSGFTYSVSFWFAFLAGLILSFVGAHYFGKYIDEPSIDIAKHIEITIRRVYREWFSSDR